MLRFTLGTARDCDRTSRRSFLQVGALAGLGISLPMALAARQARGSQRREGANCILLWTQGGTSHHDTFDPKPEAPVSIRGEFQPIATAIPGVQFTEVASRMAQEAKRFGLLRGWNPKNGSHGVADQYVMSGRPFSSAVRYPTYGSVVSYHLGFKSVLPPFVQLGTSIDRRFGGGSPGILGLAHGPFEIAADPSADNFTVRDITPPGGITSERIEFRRKVLARIDALQRKMELQPAAYEALDENYKTALNMITASQTKAAFDLRQEPAELREAYGKNRLGQSCLLARRLIEAGVRFVTVTDGGWDTHQNNFKSLKERLMPRIDQALPQLLIDLEQRGLLDSTLVVWLTDFGRTPQVNAASGRDHWASAGFAIMAGAGVPGGSVVGATDADGGFVTRDEYFSEDIATTIYAKLGIPTDLIAHAPDGRPVRLIEGREIKEWM